MSDVTVTDFIQSSGAGSLVSGQVAVGCIVCMKETLKSKIHLHAPQTFLHVVQHRKPRMMSWVILTCSMFSAIRAAAACVWYTINKRTDCTVRGAACCHCTKAARNTDEAWRQRVHWQHIRYPTSGSCIPLYASVCSLAKTQLLSTASNKPLILATRWKTWVRFQEAVPYSDSGTS